MPKTGDPARASGRPTARVGDDAVTGARVMVEAFRLTTDGSDANRVLNGILDGLVSLVEHDAAAVYVVDPLGARVSHSLARGSVNPVPVDLSAPFEDHGVVGRVLATGEPVSLHDQPGACEGRQRAHSRLVAPLVGSHGRVRGALDLWSDRPSGYDQAAEAVVGVYAAAVAATIENARLIAEVRDKRRLDSDLALARDVMTDLLPRAKNGTRQSLGEWLVANAPGVGPLDLPPLDEAPERPGAFHDWPEDDWRTFDRRDPGRETNE